MAGNPRISQVEKGLMQLRSLLMSGAFEASARLPEVALAERLDISRTPLRQAMDRLVSEGLLERIGTGGCRVASFSREDIADAIELRGVLEGTAARLAAERGADPALMAEAGQVLDRIDAAFTKSDGVDFEAYATLNAAFHDLLARLAASAVVEREVKRISKLPLASASAFAAGQRQMPDFLATLARAQGQHRDMLDAIAAREGGRAEAIARDHARLARKNLDYLTNTASELAARVPGLSLVSST